MPVKVGKGKKGKKGSKGKKKKGKKGSKGKKKKGKKAPAKLKKIAGELSTDQLLQYQIMKEDRTALQKRAKDSEDKISILDKKLHQINEDQTDIFENLRSKVEKSRAYAKVLLDQRDVLEREKKDSIEALESQLEKKAAQLRGKRNQLKMLKERWNEQQGRMQSAAQTLAVRASMEENARRLEKELEETKSINHLRESQNAIISSITEHAEIKAVAAMLLECLKQFPSLVVVQRESIQSLTKILNLKNCDLVIESGGIEMIIHAIREHRHDVTLLAACCRLMWRLYVDADHRRVCHLFAKHSARDEVLTSLQNHPSDRHLHYNVVGILKCMLGTHAAMFSKHEGSYHHHHDHGGSHHHHGGNNDMEEDDGRRRKSVSRSGSLPSLTPSTPETSSPPSSSQSSSRRQQQQQHSSSVSVLPSIQHGGGGGEGREGRASPSSAWGVETTCTTTPSGARMIAPQKMKQWRASSQYKGKKSDVKPLVKILLQCMDTYPNEESVVEKCIGVLSILLFEETEQKALNLNNYESLRSNEKTEAAREMALDAIDQTVPGGERELVQRCVNVLRIFISETHTILQGMILLLIQKILPDDPEIKTIYLRKLKEMNVHKAVFETLSLPHSMLDADLKGVGLWILEYFAMPPPGRKKKKKKVLEKGLAADFRV